MSKPSVMVVSHDYYSTEDFVAALQKELGDTAEVFAVYRVYHAEEAAPHVDLIIGDSTCKDWFAEFESVAPVLYSTARLAKTHGKPHVGRFPGGALDKVIMKAAVFKVKRLVNERKTPVA